MEKGIVPFIQRMLVVAILGSLETAISGHSITELRDRSAIRNYPSGQRPPNPPATC